MPYTVQNTSNIITGHTIQPADLLNNFNLIVTTFTNVTQSALQVQFSSNQTGVALVAGTGLGYAQPPWGFTIGGWSLVSPTSGSIVVDIQLAAAANPLGSFTSIIGSGTKPSLASQQYAASSSIGTWTTTAINAGSILRFDVVSASTTGYVLLNLNLTRSS